MMEATRSWVPWSSSGVSGTISSGASPGIWPWGGNERTGDLDLAPSCPGSEDTPAETTCGMKSSGRQAGGGGSRQGRGGLVAGVAGAGMGWWGG